MRLILWLMAGIIILAAMKVTVQVLLLVILAAFVIACIKAPLDMAVLVFTLWVISYLPNHPILASVLLLMLVIGWLMRE